MNVHIGPLTREHAGEVMTIQRAAYLAEARRYGAWDLPPLVETLDEVRRHLGDGTPAFGAFDGTRLVGSVRSRVDGERMEVARLAVAPDVQGGGVGRKLLEAISERAPAEVTVVWLFTGAESDGNIRFYESAGFVRVSEHLDAVGIRCVTLEQEVV
ncbi:GNAT family N-acetyltransferase [Lentzea flaviverrucosa]|uniref:Acetyltransferase (GNAT) domain-containing protein n=1 Tax=Lentzea flaviverrucosa TaxID=200379 RepID=A0A1H9SWM1_9PSEU|nr:GNAT family N-acetyltransferase [Lentzea flaviverrucosa]RDI25553.1 acetyltransferase (GNAT) family protein [Lentzea flaviverrucosa]SER89306.1 Acetyltransferase (GNAT) domain-containing protein [Lentzea flaviverrucosa]